MFDKPFKKSDPNQASITDQPVTDPLTTPGAGERMLPASLAARGERFFILGMVALSLSIGIVIGTFLSGGSTADNRIAMVTSKGPLNDPSIFSRVVQAVRPSVVNITSVEQAGRGLGGFFGGGGRRTGTGSGVIVNKEGYIITNNHVVADASKITVRLFDGTELKGEVVGTDPETDLAVIKVDSTGKQLIEAKMGDSDKLEVGDWVLAVGSPFGLEQTVTQGIISAKERITDGALQQFLQTDAAINPGNSGGPLVNLYGEVVGINTQIATRTGTFNGIGFALPSATAVDVYNQLVNGGKVHRGFLGIQPAKVPAIIARQNNIPEGEGALVQDLADESGPAAKAGIESGDIIIEFNGFKIKDERDLIRRVASTPVGANVVVKFVRNGTHHTVTVKLAERQLPQLSRREDPEEEDELPMPPPKSGTLGLEVETFTARKAEQLGLKLIPGVIITDVAIGSAADDAGLRRNYIILRVNGTEITSAEQFNQIMKGFKSGEEVVLQTASRAPTGDRLTRRFVTLTIP